MGGSAAAYHAGFDPGTRERVQRHFLSGKLEIVVATIAFGMGIDKADVRTVVHTALPGSVEAYYQEIGRAGRDGLPSRTVLLHSFADRKMHDFFLERDYPPPTELSRVAAVLTDEFQMPDLLRQRLKMDAETFDKAAEKLASQGAASINIEGNVRGTGSTIWRKGYDEQINFRRSQIDRMVQFAESRQCRMSSLIQHFGDTADGLRPCGHCDFCAPEQATAQTFRQPTTDEERQLRTILRTLDGTTRATGKLHTEASPHTDRKLFETYLDALARSGLITLTTDQWTNPEGNLITFKKASLTHEGRTLTGPLPPDLLIKDTSATSASSPRSRSRNTASPRLSKAERDQTSTAYTPNQKALDQHIREWRKAEAAKTGKPAFIIFSDAILQSIVLASPRNIPALLKISGIGPEKADRYGAAICALCDGRAVPGEYGEALPARAAPSKPKRPTPPTRPQPSPVEAFARQRPTPPETAGTLTPAQQALDERLHEWRKAESEKLGVPQFFVLASSTLRSIVLARPQTLSQLKTINGLNLEKVEKFGSAIVEACTS